MLFMSTHSKYDLIDVMYTIRVIVNNTSGGLSPHKSD